MSNRRYQTEDQKEIKKFIIIILALILSLGAIYFVTDRFVKKGEDTTTIPGSINYEKATIGTMLNKSISEYYVFIYDSKSNSATYYNSLRNTYSQKEDGLKIFFVDLDNELNKPYYNVNNDNISNNKAKTIEELDLGDITLIKVKDGNIVEYEESEDNIANILM